MSELTLEQVLDRKLWPAKPLRLSILRQIGESLDRAHSQGTLHGNLSPRYVFVSTDLETPEPKVRVSDFGSRFSPDHELVVGESVPEPARYMSPERILGIDMTARSDQFSLGLIAYEFVCGRPAFDAPTISPLFYQVCAEQPPDPEDIDNTLSRAVGKVFSRVLAKDPQHRFSTCSAFIDALSLSLEDCEGWTQSSEPPLPKGRAMAAAAGAAVASAPVAAPEVAPRTAATTLLETRPEPAPLPEPQIAVAPPFEYPSRRRRRPDPDEPDDRTAAKREGGSGKWILLAVIALLVIIAAAIWSRQRKPDLPVQVADTRNAPLTPPPPDVQSPPENSATHAGTPASGTRPAAAAPTAAAPAPEVHKAPPAPAEMSTPSEPSGRYTGVNMATEPGGASIVVDGDDARSCITPCTISLSRGRHTLRAALPGYSAAQRIFQVPEEIPVNIALVKQTGALVVTSDPSGATVVVDGRRYGTTPATLQLSPGPHEVEVTSDGRRQVQNVNVQADGIQAKRFTW